MKEKFENIWNTFHSSLSKFVEKRIYDNGQKDDCLQEIFIKINNGLSQKEISEKENLSLSCVKSRIQRGRIKLKNALIGCCKFETDRRGNVLDYRPNHDNCTPC